MKKKIKILRGDTALWVVYLLLCCISLIEVFSTIGLSAIADMHSSPIRIFFTKHLVFVSLSIIIVAAFTRFNYRWFSGISKIAYVLSVGLLIVALFMNTRWIPIFGFNLQPSELAKIVLMVFMARLIVRNKENRDEKMTFWAILAPAILVSLLVGFENLSTGLLIIVASYLMMLFGGINKQLWRKVFFIGLAIFAVGFVFIYFYGDSIDFARSSTWGHRLQAWRNPDPNELNQENMARMAVARGGFLGKGFGTTIHGRLMTQAHNDFIYSIIIEEHGLLGAIIIFLLYAFFYFRCMRIVSRCKGEFGKLCVAGIGTIIFLQAMLNMSVAVGVLPVTGQTLPFISYGGSSFIFLGMGMGIIQSVAYDNQKTAHQERKAAAMAANTAGAEASASPDATSNTEITETSK